MPVSEAQKRASAKYNKENTKLFNIRLMLTTDSDIISFLETLKNKQGYVKKLIRADMARIMAEKKNDINMKTWYIIDDLNPTPIRAKSEDDAARIMRETWLALTEHERAERFGFYVALCAKDVKGNVDLDSAEHVHQAVDADQVMLMYYNDLLREMTDAYRTVLESDGALQESIYIWSDGTIQVLEDVQGGSSILVPPSRGSRKLYHVATIDAPCVDVFSLSGSDPSECSKEDAIDWLVDTYDDEARERLNQAIDDAEKDRSMQA